VGTACAVPFFADPAGVNRLRDSAKIAVGMSRRGETVPTGKVKWFNAEKGFGFLADDEGEEVFVHRDALPEGVSELRPGARVEFGVVSGRKGNQALSVRVLDPVPSVVRATRKPADEMTPIVEDLIKLLDSVSNQLRRGRYPDKAEGRKVAAVLRAVADNLDV
jgi:CspA family cold shock protein